MKMIISHWILWVNSTHFVDATCSEVDWSQHKNAWISLIVGWCRMVKTMFSYINLSWKIDTPNWSGFVWKFWELPKIQRCCHHPSSKNCDFWGSPILNQTQNLFSCHAQQTPDLCHQQWNWTVLRGEGFGGSIRSTLGCKTPIAWKNVYTHAICIIYIEYIYISEYCFLKTWGIRCLLNFSVLLEISARQGQNATWGGNFFRF
jgi:hypothetical protein